MPSPIANFFVKAIVQSPLHPILGPGFAVVTVTGCRTGRRRTTPINVHTQHGGYTVLSYRNRKWWRNLRREAHAQLTVKGKTFPVSATVLEEPGQVARELTDYFAEYPRYAKYFQVNLGEGGKPVPSDIKKAAAQRIVVRLSPCVRGTPGR
jgi:deazaflavin-dependent oxidoreductase (nitroreductase family)